ncbi:MAG: tetratricopeptide repeat protein [Flavobacteriales bacterium]|nr:tetratricopeptide repeat protein [Flavobacteriales bacterium]MCB9192650.1 tetratricopeptide repeat protein [Flavobacteriales bacterium]
MLRYFRLLVVGGLVWTVCSIPTFGQQAQVDSLLRLLESDFSSKDSRRIDVLAETAELLLRIDPDRSLDLSKEALRLSITTGYQDKISHIYNNTGTANRLRGEYGKALTFHNKALENDRRSGNRKDEALSLNNIGNVYLKQGDYPAAISNYETSLEIRQDIDDLEGIASSLNNLGLVYRSQGDVERALVYYQNAYKMFEQLNDKVGLANTLNNIGIVHRGNRNLEKALESFLQALDMFRKLGNNVGESNTLNNIGNIYYQQEKFDQALEFYEKSLAISETIGDKSAAAGQYSNIGGVHLALGDSNQALKSTEKALVLQKEIGDDKGQISTLNNLGAYYMETKGYDRSLGYFLAAEKVQKRIGDHSYSTVTLSSIGDLYKAKQQPKLGLQYLNKALAEAKRYGTTEDQIGVYDKLAQAYADMGDFKRSYDFQQRAKTVKDSLDRMVSSRELAEMQIKFETEQKQREIELLSKEKEVQDLKITKQNTLRNMIIAVAILALLMVALIYARYRTKQKANEILDRKNQEIEAQKRTVEEKNWEITSSIEYAKRIQDAIMPTMDQIRADIPNCFVYYRPKEIVSGDFYWYAKNGDEVFIAAVDCTGHGVPGAFMSMIGNDHLNQIVNTEKRTKPNEILNRLHHEIQVTLKQKHGVTDNHDGMDIALCAINQSKNRLLFASANRYLYMIRNGELQEVKGDHFNIGGIMHEDVRQYNLHEIELQKNDVFYIFSDGVSDQFGGDQSKKFGYKRLKNLLTEIHQLPMDEQKTTFEKTLTDWMGNNDQIDDFLLIGIRI